MNYNEEFKKVLLGEPHMILGKKGITSELIAHASNLLKKHKIIKIKALKSIATKSNIKNLAKQITDSTDSYLLDLRGKIFIISSTKIKNET